MSKLYISRNDNETWLQAALRLAKPHGLEREIQEAYDGYRANGDDEAEAAWCACYDWDVLELHKGNSK